MKRYFGLFTKSYGMHSTSANHNNPVIIGEPVEIKKQEAPVVEHNDNVVDEVVKTPIVQANEDNPRRKRKSKKASDSPSDNQEVGDT